MLAHFYVGKIEKARDAVEKLRLQESINVDKYLKAPGEGSTTVSLQKLLQDEENGLDQSTRVVVESMYNLLDELQALRKYVATNVIAATKIVKKHDKNSDSKPFEKARNCRFSR